MDKTTSKILQALNNSVEEPIKDLNFQTNMENTIEWTSLVLTEFIFNLEESFDIDIELDDAEKLTSIEITKEILEKKYLKRNT
tara:strand:+ start:255 stop:503 length:249 start_codon:yes stop_codon:yes gene_type:complete